MIYPKQIKTRRKIDALTGIKSSLDQIRSVVSLVYLTYIANGRKAFTRYSKQEGSIIMLEPDLQKSIENFLGHENLGDILNRNPLITNQYEPLYVGVTLLMKLGYLKMEGRQNTAERTGGVRYPKQLYFANNILVLDLILQGFPEKTRQESLYEWLQNQKATNNEFEERVCKFISTCTCHTQFKLRDNNNEELFFQTEGIYKALLEANGDVLYSDSHEFVGPTRIYNNVLREGLEPWIEISRNVLSLKGKVNPDAESMSQILSTTLDIYNVKDDSFISEDGDNDNTSHLLGDEPSLQQIFYGAPGTGKSHKIKDDEKVKRADEKNLVFRTTFHPDSDYSTFVGAYKPTMRPVADKYKAVAGKDEEITYSFVPQAFLQAYVAAWNNQDENVFLVIEEINRGNCAQIFGDLFQLLDRDDNGCSEYPIMADKDLAKYLNGKDETGNEVLTNKDGIKDGKLCLPSNLHIWATMNTSDQSLFPIDSAFKRRWEWKYMPIEDAGKGWQIVVNGHEYDWYRFLEAINKEVLDLTHSEDKQLGYFFAKAKDNKIDATTLVNKVYFYLWTDVFKDYDFESQKAFRKAGSNEAIAFKDFFKAGEVDEVMAEQVLINLELYKPQEPTE